MKLNGKVAVITGGASGQGRAAALLFASEGARVVAADWNAEGAEAICADIRAAGGQAVAVRADVSREADVAAMIRTALDTFQRLDILFNNAGIWSATGRFSNLSVVDTSEAHWDKVLAVNLKGVAMGCKHAIPVMVKQGGGVIINNASIDGLVAMSGADAYTASKGGVIALTRVLAVDWGPKGIRANCICPGEVDTPMTHTVLLHPKSIEHTLANCPLRRTASPEEIARVALFLASDAASYVNGAIIPVDGGWTAR